MVTHQLSLSVNLVASAVVLGFHIHACGLALRTMVSLEKPLDFSPSLCLEVTGSSSWEDLFCFWSPPRNSHLVT